MAINYRKAAVIGCGFVGASIAFRFLQQGLFSHLVLVDANREKLLRRVRSSRSMRTC